MAIKAPHNHKRIVDLIAQHCKVKVGGLLLVESLSLQPILSSFPFPGNREAIFTFYVVL